MSTISTKAYITLFVVGVIVLTGCGRKAPLVHPPVEVEETADESKSKARKDNGDNSFILDNLIK